MPEAAALMRRVGSTHRRDAVCRKVPGEPDLDDDLDSDVPIVAVAADTFEPPYSEPPAHQLDLSVFDAQWKPGMRYAIVWKDPEGALSIVKQTAHVGEALSQYAVHAKHIRYGDDGWRKDDWRHENTRHGTFHILPKTDEPRARIALHR